MSALVARPRIINRVKEFIRPDNAYMVQPLSTLLLVHGCFEFQDCFSCFVVVRIALFLCLLSFRVTNFVTYTQVCFISTPDEAELASTLGLDVLGTHPELQ